MRIRNKMKNSSRIKIIEVSSSCCGFLYKLYRRKVHPATLAVFVHREFLGILQNVRPAQVLLIYYLALQVQPQEIRKMIEVQSKFLKKFHSIVNNNNEDWQD